MGVQEREYMDRPFIDVESEGVAAENQDQAARLLHFSCPTMAANGLWYRTTLAVTNVPVFELFNVISRANAVARRLSKIAESLPPEEKMRVTAEAGTLAGLADLLKRGMGGGVSPFTTKGNHNE